MGHGALKIFSSFNEDVDKIKYEDLIKKFEKYFLPKINLAIERHKFFTCAQKPTESIEDFITGLKNLSLNCEFGTLRESLVRDIFVCGLSQQNIQIKEKLLSEGNISLDKAVEIAKSTVLTRVHSRQIQSNSSDSLFVGAVQNMKFKNSTQTNKSYNKKPVNNFFSQSTKQIKGKQKIFVRSVVNFTDFDVQL
ncbi:uncharacterized protein LOC129616540 [Condylostylus longicornis]|uniref:uncharacterized protein LOC129616540 n=1 Tax=Condylostylus longicornis TaxID=2530218 RepID=UPI00244DE914|nr:uncharacterized protein LOC129616540 [Condylostylus longicornis]